LWAGLAGGDAYRGTPVIVKMENPNWSISEVDGGEDFLPGPGGRRRRGKNAKQITWVLLLKAHRAAGCLAWLASAAVTLGCAARRRVAAGRTDSDANQGECEGEEEEAAHAVRRSRFYAFIKACLLMSVFLLAVEVAAHSNGRGALAVFAASFYASWVRVRAAYLAPPLQLLADACVVLFLVQSADRLVQSLGCFYILLKRIKPKPISPALRDAEDPDAGYYPMVLVQIPMCNEKEVRTIALPRCHHLQSSIAPTVSIFPQKIQMFHHDSRLLFRSGVSAVDCGGLQFRLAKVQLPCTGAGRLR
jgi:hypothetical protein